MWFIIEILTFYGYIVSAVGFIAWNQIHKSLGFHQPVRYAERYKYGFLQYHKDALKWLSLLTILLGVTAVILIIDLNNENFDHKN